MSRSDPCLKASELIQRGKIISALDQVKRCKKHLRTQLQKLPSERDLINQQLARVLRLESQIYTSQEKFSNAIGSLLKANEIMSSLPHSSDNLILSANIQYSLGLVQMVTGDYQNSMLNYSSSMELFTQLKQYKEASDIGFRLVELYYQQKDYDQTLKLIAICEKQTKKIKMNDDKAAGLTRLKVMEAKTLQNLGKEEDALKILEKARKSVDKSKDYPNLLLILSEIADLNFKKGEYSRSEEYYLELHDLAVSAKLPKFEALALMQLGIIALRNSRLKEGQKRLLKGLKIRTELGDKVGTAQVLVELARISFLISQTELDLNKAHEFATQALELYTESNFDYGMAQSLEILSNIQLRMNNMDEAYRSINQSLKLFKKFKDKDGEGRMLTQLAIVLDQLGRSNEIDAVLDKAEKNFIHIKNNQGLAEVLHIRSQLEKDLDSALKYLKQCRELYVSVIGNNENLKPILIAIDNKIQELTSQ